MTGFVPGIFASAPPSPPQSPRVAQTLTPPEFITNDVYTGVLLPAAQASGGIPDGPYTYSLGAGGAGHTIDSVTGEVTVITPPAAGQRSLEIIATSSSGAASFTRPETVQSAPGMHPLGTVRILGHPSITQTNLPVRFGIPLLGGDMAGTDMIALLVGGASLPVQEDNRCTDLNGDIRWVLVHTILPSLPGGGFVDINYGRIAGTPASGTAKTVAQLLAMNAEVEVTANTNDGTARSAKMRAAAGGSTTWTKGQPRLRAGFYCNGPICKEFICDAPQVDSGNVADPFLFNTFHVAYFSLDNFATIDRVRVTCVLNNGYVAQAAPADRNLSASIVVGITTPSTPINLATTIPAVALSVAILTAGKYATLTGPAGTFNVNNQGQVITHGSDWVTVIYVPPDGSYAVCYISSLAAPATWDSGTWTMWGHRIPFATHSVLPDVWYGTAASYKVLYRPDLLKRSELILNYGAPSSGLSNVAPMTFSLEQGWDVIALDGTHPAALRKSHTNEATGEVVRGERNIDSQDEARVVPNWQVSSLLRTDSGGFMEEKGWDRIFHTARLWDSALQYCNIDDSTGHYVHWNTTTPVSRAKWNYNAVKTPSPRGFSIQPDVAHEDEMGYIPFLMTGDFCWLDGIHMRAFYRWSYIGTASRNFNDGGDKRWSWQGTTVRACTWGDRNFAHAAFCTPNNMPAGLLGHTKTDWRYQLSYTGAKTKALYAVTPTGWSLETPAGPSKGAAGPVYLNIGTIIYHPWQQAYCRPVGAHIKEIGEMPADLLTFYSTFFMNLIEQMTNIAVTSQEATPQIARDNLAGVGHPLQYKYSDTIPDWAGLYPLLKAITQNNGYAAFEWGGAVLNKTWNCYGTTDQQNTVLDYYANFLTSRGLTGAAGTFDLTQVASWAPYVAESYLEVR